MPFKAGNYKENVKHSCETLAKELHNLSHKYLCKNSKKSANLITITQTWFAYQEHILE